MQNNRVHTSEVTDSDYILQHCWCFFLCVCVCTVCVSIKENPFSILKTNVFFFLFLGTFVIEVNATDADDATYGNSAKLVYSILQGQPYFSVDPETGETSKHIVENIFSADKLLWCMPEATRWGGDVTFYVECLKHEDHTPLCLLKRSSYY